MLEHSKKGSIFLLQGDAKLVEMTEAPYESEDLLQRLLAQYPQLLAGDQVDSANPRKWLLVSRELAIPDEEDGSARWALDHLFLDQDAIPTLVEVKRCSDSRARREVVAQMLDYAANSVVYLPVEAIRTAFEKTCTASGLSPDQALVNFLGDDPPADFWIRVKTNLQAGRIRLVFVADEIPAELRRIVEFLNEQMILAQVLALEVKQFKSAEGLTTLVPRVIGQTAEAERTKSAGSRPKRSWDEESFFKALSEKGTDEVVAVARAILDWTKGHPPFHVEWGRGSTVGSAQLTLDWKGNCYVPIVIWTYGKFEVQFYQIKARPPFTEEAKRRGFLDRLNSIPGLSIPADSLTGRAPIYLSTLTDRAALDGFLNALDWFFQEVKGP